MSQANKTLGFATAKTSVAPVLVDPITLIKGRASLSNALTLMEQEPYGIALGAQYVTFEFYTLDPVRAGAFASYLCDALKNSQIVAGEALASVTGKKVILNKQVLERNIYASPIDERNKAELMALASLVAAKAEEMRIPQEREERQQRPQARRATPPMRHAPRTEYEKYEF